MEEQEQRVRRFEEVVVVVAWIFDTWRPQIEIFDDLFSQFSPLKTSGSLVCLRLMHS